MKIPSLHILVADATSGRRAIECGAELVQLRNKNLSDRAFLLEASQLREWTRKHGKSLCINDRCHIARIVQSDFVHLGPNDLPLPEARLVLGESIGIGISVDTPDEAKQAERLGADYLGAGPFAATSSKLDAGPVLGLEGLREIVKSVSIPVIAIGAIDDKNLTEVLRSQCHGFAILSAFREHNAPERAVQNWLKHLERARDFGV